MKSEQQIREKLRRLKSQPFHPEYPQELRDKVNDENQALIALLEWILN